MIELKVDKKQLALMLEGVSRITTDLSNSTTSLKNIDSLLDLRNYLSEVLANELTHKSECKLHQLSEYNVNVKHNEVIITTYELPKKLNIRRIFIDYSIPKSEEE
jgi:hypothetical protein